MAEWGLFSEEGLIEGDFLTREDALLARRERYTPDDELEVYEVCPHHPEQSSHDCEDCNNAE